MSINILLAEDEDDIRDLVALHLRNSNYNVFEAKDGAMALKVFEENHIDLLILDIMMPKLDGISVLKSIRQISQIPVIFLTAKIEEEDKILGLGLGADDYITKPFSLVELQSRVQAILRRCNEYNPLDKKNIIKNNYLELDLNTYSLKKEGNNIDLNPKEFKLISLFMQNLDIVYTKKQLYEKVWEELYWGDDNTIMVHISHLRDKIEVDPKKPQFIKTIRGIGYRMEKVK